MTVHMPRKPKGPKMVKLWPPPSKGKGTPAAVARARKMAKGKQ